MGKAPMDREEKPWGKLLDICREAKEGLTQNSRRILIDVESALGKQAPMPEVALPVSTFYEKCSELIEKTIQVMVPVLARDEVVDGGMGTLPGIAGIYVVGGASSLPAVGRSLRQRFGRRVHRSPYPSAATAIGLAIAGDRSAGYHLTDRFSRAFGVFRELRDGASISFDLVFTKDTRMPAVEEGMVVSTRTYRAAHNIGHFRYIECDTVDDKGGPAGNITPFAEVFFPFDPSLWEKKETLASETVRRLSSPGPLVEEQYTVDVDGIVEVRIRHLDGGYEQVFRLWE
jgi:molecular chaperone DnaK (HSP70)